MFTVRYVPTVDPQTITHRICFNPHYGGPSTAVPGTCMVPISARGIKPRTRKAIETSIRREGFRNPILLYNTPEGLLLSFGGGRLQAAKNLDKRIRAIVVDYTDDYALFEEVDEDNWQEFFMDIPAIFEFTEVGIDHHYALERGRTEWYDPAGIEWTKNERDDSFLYDESPWLDSGS